MLSAPLLVVIGWISERTYEMGRRRRRSILSSTTQVVWQKSSSPVSPWLLTCREGYFPDVGEGSLVMQLL